MSQNRDMGYPLFAATLDGEHVDVLAAEEFG